jgi:hypothetical protein
VSYCCESHEAILVREAASTRVRVPTHTRYAFARFAFIDLVKGLVAALDCELHEIREGRVLVMAKKGD